MAIKYCVDIVDGAPETEIFQILICETLLQVIVYDDIIDLGTLQVDDT
jgi:hypothetical protein